MPTHDQIRSAIRDFFKYLVSDSFLKTQPLVTTAGLFGQVFLFSFGEIFGQTIKLFFTVQVPSSATCSSHRNDTSRRSNCRLSTQVPARWRSWLLAASRICSVGYPCHVPSLRPSSAPSSTSLRSAARCRRGRLVAKGHRQQRQPVSLVTKRWGCAPCVVSTNC